MNDLLHVEGIPGLRKDAQSGGVLNTDRDALLAARELQARKLNEKAHIDNLEKKVERLEGLLNQLLEEMKNGK
jgi:hypothetical protein